MKYDYLIIYNFTNEVGSGFGNIDLTLEDKIKNFDDLENIRNFIKDKNSFKGVVIMDYKLLKTWR